MQRGVVLLIALSVVFLVWSCGGVSWQGRDPVRAELPVSDHPSLAKAGLIHIAAVDSSIVIDLQYKKGSAIAKKALYQANMPALLRPETAVRLKRANALVKKHGYRLKVWDAYRPPSAQIQLWNASGHNDRFVANPYSAPSQHSCGTAVDVTLVRKNHEAVEMPTGFDNFTPQAASNYQFLSPELLKRRTILQRAMHEAGFYALPNEWWHYMDRKFKDYPETIPLKDIEGSF